MIGTEYPWFWKFNIGETLTVWKAQRFDPLVTLCDSHLHQVWKHLPRLCHIYFYAHRTAGMHWRRRKTENHCSVSAPKCLGGSKLLFQNVGDHRGLGGGPLEPSPDLWLHRILPLSSSLVLTHICCVTSDRHGCLCKSPESTTGRQEKKKSQLPFKHRKLVVGQSIWRSWAPLSCKKVWLFKKVSVLQNQSNDISRRNVKWNSKTCQKRMKKICYYKWELIAITKWISSHIKDRRLDKDCAVTHCSSSKGSTLAGWI